jgi:hypothetical protein
MPRATERRGGKAVKPAPSHRARGWANDEATECERGEAQSVECRPFLVPPYLTALLVLVLVLIGVLA